MAEPRWTVLTNAEAVAQAAAERILAAAEKAIAERGRFRIVLAGGTTPRMTFERLAKAESLWRAWEVYFGDERCLPVDHADRNSLMARQALLGQVPIPPEQCFPIPAERGAEAAARGYAGVVDVARPFDVVMLGMGEDGHTASLFPGQAHPQSVSAVAVHDAPKPPPDRVSLSAEALADCRELLILVTGAGKRAAVAAWRRGSALPIAQVAELGNAEVLIDQAAMVEAE